MIKSNKNYPVINAGEISSQKPVAEKRWRLRAFKVLLLLILFSVLDELIGPSPLPFSVGISLIHRVVLGFLYIATIFGFLVALLSRSLWICWCSLVWGILTFGLQVVYLCATGSGFYAEEAYLLLTSMESALNCIDLYWWLALPGVFVFVTGLTLGTLFLRRFVISFSPWWMFASIVVFGVSLMATWFSSGSLNTLSTPYRIPSMLTYMKATRYLGPRQPTFIPANGLTLQRIPHIVLIVDESVIGSELSINGYSRSTVPFLENHRDMYWNGGIASSGSTNTSDSNSMLLSGLRPEQLPDVKQRADKNPSIFQYAVQAGYPSLCLSAQHVRTILTRGLPAYSAERFSYVERINSAHDFDLIDTLRQQISNHDASFTYIVKRGNHFPYAARYPKDRGIFRPTAPPEWVDDLALNVNTYDNALRWNCDEFFARMTKSLESTHKSIIVIYTSDHGEVLPGQAETRGAIRMPHGHPHLPPIVANVPLLVFGFGPKGADFLHRLQSNDTLVNNCSHFQIFPTLLLSMGYPPGDIRRYYGDSLLDTLQTGRSRCFIAGGLNSVRSRIIPFPSEQNTIAGRLYSPVMKWDYAKMQTAPQTLPE
ncbi:MAG: sulfatase-like hydrolase/transferase [Smithella sp.]|jgi:lipid A ethanolaminephosphotransferase